VQYHPGKTIVPKLLILPMEQIFGILRRFHPSSYKFQGVPVGGIFGGQEDCSPNGPSYKATSTKDTRTSSTASWAKGRIENCTRETTSQQVEDAIVPNVCLHAGTI
jgi:hypothetical protein